MKQIFMVMALFSLVGCREVVSRKVVGPTVITHEVIGCHHFSYCFICMGHCGFTYSSMCPGHQTATVHSTPYLVQYDDGSNSHIVDKSYSDLGICH